MPLVVIVPPIELVPVTSTIENPLLFVIELPLSIDKVFVVNFWFTKSKGLLTKVNELKLKSLVVFSVTLKVSKLDNFKSVSKVTVPFEAVKLRLFAVEYLTTTIPDPPSPPWLVAL